MKFKEITEDTLFTIEADPDIIYLKVKPQKKTCCKPGYNCIYYGENDKKSNTTIEDNMEVFVLGQLTEEDVELIVEEEINSVADEKEAIINDGKMLPNPEPKKFGGGGMGQKYPKQRNPRNKNDF